MFIHFDHFTSHFVNFIPINAEIFTHSCENKKMNTAGKVFAPLDISPLMSRENTE